MNVLLVCGFDSSHIRSHFYFAVCRCAHWLQDRSRNGVIIVIAAVELHSWCRNVSHAMSASLWVQLLLHLLRHAFLLFPWWLRLEKLQSTWGCHIQAATASGMMVFLWKTIRWNSDVVRGPQRSSGRLTPTEHMPVRIHINSLMY